MRLAGAFEIILTLALVLIAAYPLGAFMADVFENRRTFLTPIVGPVERGLYRVAGIDPEAEQKWYEYAISMVAFGGACMLSLYALLRLQAYLPLNPQGFPGVPPGLAFNIAVSFITNTNWQAYAGETTLSHFSQMVGLTTNNFLDSAAATAMAVALTRALARRESPTIGNFWVDMTRTTLYVLLPLSLVVALAFAALGVPQTLSASAEATTLGGAKQIIALGPVASQETIKLIGDNGGGFFNANSAHPFENPNVWSNILQNWSQLVLPVALVFAFGRMVGDWRQGRTLLVTMAVIFVTATGRLLVPSAQQSRADRPRHRPLDGQNGRRGRAFRAGRGSAVHRRDDRHRNRCLERGARIGDSGRRTGRPVQLATRLRLARRRRHWAL
jgi:K+-transporting ATPase ATPase A chain